MGKNGSGKTNLLDALYCLAFTRSAFSTTDEQYRHWGAPFYLLQATVASPDHDVQVQLAQKEQERKELRINHEPVARLGDHIGRIPLILITPEDPTLVTGGSELRRKSIDGLLAQLSPAYLSALQAYGHLLQQRNAYLKQLATTQRPPDAQLLHTYSEKMLPHAQLLVQHRQQGTQQLAPLLHSYYRQLSQDAEQADIHYSPNLDTEALATAWHQALPADIASRRTTLGPHRDDWNLTLAHLPAKQHASQGQLKTLTLAFKLAQKALLKQHLQRDPVLLLDDIFDRLDDDRIRQLLLLIHAEGGQTFITDARPERSLQLIAKLNLPCARYWVSPGHARQLGPKEALPASS